MAVPPIRLLRPSALKIDADSPCVLEMRIPIALPYRLDPSLPAPPYHPGTITAEQFRALHAMPLLRGLMAQIVSHMFGPEYAAATLEAPTQATSPPCDLRLLATWDASTIFDKENGLDFAAGYWKDTYGREGHGPIDASQGDLWGRILIFHKFKLSLIRGVRDAKQLEEMYPRAFRFDVIEEGSGESGHEVVFEVREYTEDIRKRHVNVTLSVPMKFGDDSAASGQ